MDPFTLAVLIGLASLGAAVIAAFATAMAYAILFALLFLTVVGIAIVGMIGDHFYTKKMLRKEAPYRLPWYYRWKGWRVGGDPDSHDYKRGMFYDRRVNHLVGMVRSTN
ncbi:MAG: hypothetical protein HY457_01045 [Parcubacteria group bacterium]|nr:hypothetical protein [Parcubacteria group bacterium]